MTENKKGKTPKTSRKKRKKQLPFKKLEYEAFIKWLALPEPLRKPKTQTEFAKNYGLNDTTLSEWKNRPEFWREVRKRWQSWGKEKTGNVLLKLYSHAMSTKGGFESVKLWLEYFGELSEKLEITETIANNPISQMSTEQLKDFINKRIKIIKACDKP